MKQHRRALAASLGIAGIFLVVQLGTLALVEPFEAGGLQPDVDHSDPTNSLLYIGAILVATALMLVAIRLDALGVIRAVIVFSGAYVAVFVFQVVFPPVLVVWGFHVLAWAGGAALGLALWWYPEWYVVDTAGIVMGIAAAALFGITFGVLPALVLLVALGVYDAISVYGTEHMLTLAGGVMEMRVPVVLVIPLSMTYSFLDADLPDPSADRTDDSTAEAAAPDERGAEEGFDRDALFIGLGDAVIPTVLVASAAFFAPGGVPSLSVPGLALTLPALTAMVGTFLGLAVLLWMVLKGRAHAGLPLLNGGAIVGYLAGSLASGVALAEAIGIAQFL